MATNVIMPVLGMVQESAKIVHWLKDVGDTVTQGEILMEVETDKAVEELEAPATGIVGQILANEGDDVPVTQVVAVILTPEEYQSTLTRNDAQAAQPEMPPSISGNEFRLDEHASQVTVTASPLASRMARENNLALAWIKPQGGHVEKADVVAYLAGHAAVAASNRHDGRILASPKARRLALENNQDLTSLQGSGPGGAIIAQDVKINAAKASGIPALTPTTVPGISSRKAPEVLLASRPIVTTTLWRRMAEHTSSSWAAAPHFYLHRTVKAARLLSWHAHLQQDSKEKITISDLLVLIVSRALLKYPRVNVVWQNEEINGLSEINVGLAVAVDDGLVVPVIHHADRLSATEIAGERKELVARAQSGKLRMEDISSGTFTISNLGMYGIDSFDAVLNGPQAAILAVGRISEQVIPVNGAPVIQPMMNLSVSFDHRAVDGATGAKFLATLADMVEEPLMLLS